MKNIVGEPIQRDRCRLMTAGLVDRYEHLDAQFNRVCETLHHLSERERFVELQKRLALLKEQMERPRYYVGFLGRSQVGKSSTLNSVLGAAPGQGPGTGGAGAPATSTITRLYRRGPAENGEPPGHLCTLRYMTPAQFRRRRDDLCKLLGLDPEEQDIILLRTLDELLRREQEDPAARDKPTSAKTEDRRYLARLLRSAEKNPGLLLDQPKVEKGDYLKRSEYTNHPEGAVQSPYLLLQEVVIAYDTQAISAEIELIDLPGLGARLASDDLLTESFLPQLDGALIFQSTEQVAANEAYKLIAELSKHFKRVRGRVWMVFTRFDSLGPDHYGAHGRENILDNIHKTLSDNRVPPEQVLMVGNHFYLELLGPDGVPVRPSAASYKYVLKLEVDEAGEPVIPPGFQRHPELIAAYQEVLRDGGIGKIRDVIGTGIAHEVEREVREAVDAELTDVAGALRRQLIAAKDAARMDTSSLLRTAQWKSEIQQVAHEVRQKREMLETPTKAQAAYLKELFAGIYRSTLVIPRSKLPGTHAECITIMKVEAMNRARTETVPLMYNAVTERLKAAEQKLGKVRTGDRESPLQVWNERAEQDSLIDLSWYAREIDAFQTPELFPSGDDDVGLLYKQYIELMPRKIDAVTQKAAFAAQRRILGHLEAIVEDLVLINTNNGQMDEVDSRQYDEIIAALR
jgi:hypothetical protein